MDIPDDWEQILNDFAALEAENLVLRAALEQLKANQSGPEWEA